MSENDTSKCLDRRDFLKIGAAAAATAAVNPMTVGQALAAGAKGKRPNILFVFSDEHRWCSLPFTEMPEVTAPNMAKLASQGLQFSNCISTSPICVPYRGMLMTGMYPHQSSAVSNDMFYNPAVIGKEAPTIAHTFKAAGYATGYVGKWHLKNQTVYDAGFDYFKHWLYGDEHWDTQVRDVPSHEAFKSVKGYNAIGMTDQAMDFINQQADGDKPWMMILSINPPHWRWDDAPEEDVELYPDEKIPFRPNVAERYKSGKEKKYYRHYHAHITAIDRQLGRLMKMLADKGLEEDTIVVYTSDHGSSFGSNGVGSKANPFEEAIRTPFIIRWPGRIEAGKVVDNLMGTVDVHATLCGLAGTKPADHCQGIDFSPVILGKDGPDPETQPILVNNFVRNYFRNIVDPGDWNWFTPFRGVRSKRYTYVVRAKGDWVLYDNEKDPYQLKNVVNDPAYAEAKALMQAELTKWLTKIEDPFISDEWKKLSLPDRIWAENEYYSMLRYGRKWDKYKADAVKALGSSAKADQLQAIADEVFDLKYFGTYMALDNAANGRKRYTKKPKAEMAAKRDAHEQKAMADFKAKAAKVLARAV